ncbi:MAG: nitroreductase family protein [Chloroflexota bacterium]|nr:nitroreductase family protein [Chloroflexota bacterium]
MDIYRAIKTMRAVRQYAEQSVDHEIITRILDAGRWAGSSKNTQPWQFVVVKNRDTLNRLADCGTYASHLRDAAFAIVIVTEPTPRADFDSGRAIQNIMLAAWNDGVGSCIASMHREAEAKKILGIPEHLKLQQAIAFGYPQPEVTPTIKGKPLKDVLAATGRRALAEIVHFEKWSEKK